MRLLQSCEPVIRSSGHRFIRSSGHHATTVWQIGVIHPLIGGPVRHPSSQMPEAHMRRKTSSRPGGRPRGPEPLFVEDCTRLDATVLLAKTRGGPSHDELTAFPIGITWEGGRRSRSIVLPVVSTPQPLGGSRRWSACPTCHRRYRVLLIVSGDGPVACRRCLGAVYSADYPGRHQWRQIAALLRGFVLERSIPSVEQRRRELDVLLAKRRRSVRRGRRLLVRALREIRLAAKEPDRVTSLLSEYGR